MQLTIAKHITDVACRLGTEKGSLLLTFCNIPTGLTWWGQGFGAEINGDAAPTVLMGLFKCMDGSVFIPDVKKEKQNVTVASKGRECLKKPKEWRITMDLYFWRM